MENSISFLYDLACVCFQWDIKVKVTLILRVIESRGMQTTVRMNERIVGYCGVL